MRVFDLKPSTKKMVVCEHSCLSSRGASRSSLKKNPGVFEG